MKYRILLRKKQFGVLSDGVEEIEEFEVDTDAKAKKYYQERKKQIRMAIFNEDAIYYWLVDGLIRVDQKEKTTVLS